jgi:uncharacterized protein (DUF433 family)
MPGIKGTRAPVSGILSLLKKEYMLNEIHEQFDHINRATLERTIEEVTTIMNQTPHGTPIL